MPLIAALLFIYWMWGVELRAWLTATAAKMDNDPTNDPPADDKDPTGDGGTGDGTTDGPVTVSDGSATGPGGSTPTPRPVLNIPTGTSL